MAAPEVPQIKMFLNHNEGEKVYFSGETVNGCIQITLTEPKWYQYMAVKLLGKSTVMWSEKAIVRSGAQTRETTRKFFDEDTHLNIEVVIWGSKEAPQPKKLDSGTSTFPFEFTVPQKCPPTFSKDTGKNTYTLFGIVSSQVNEYKIQTTLNIRNVVDLNLQPDLLHPFNKFVKDEIVKCCCCGEGEVSIRVDMPQTGFCLTNDRIQITVECTNGSTEQSLHVEANLTEAISYKAKGHRKCDEGTINMFSCQIPPTKSATKTVDKNIPRSTVLDFKSSLIEVSHSVDIDLNIDHSVTTLLLLPNIKIPVVIGNVPFRNTEILGQNPTKDLSADKTSSMENPPVQCNASCPTPEILAPSEGKDSPDP